MFLKWLIFTNQNRKSPNVKYPGPRPTQSWSFPWQDEWLKSQGRPVSVQNAPRTFGLTSPTLDWQKAPMNRLPSFFLTLNSWLVFFSHSSPPVAFNFDACFDNNWFTISFIRRINFSQKYSSLWTHEFVFCIHKNNYFSINYSTLIMSSYKLTRCGRKIFRCRRKPVLEEPSRGTFVIATNKFIISAHGSSVCRKPAKCSDALAGLAVHKLQNRHQRIDVFGISCPFFRWIKQVCTWTPTYPCILQIPCHHQNNVSGYLEY